MINGISYNIIVTKAYLDRNLKVNCCCIESKRTLFAKCTRASAGTHAATAHNASQASLDAQTHRAAQRNDLIESRASHLFIQCSGGCERDGAAKLAH